ncbi:MAG TPA: AI-2E family transporter [Candidatus Nanoarchaeia archaeon]|nr:AI-2E family transporter [Candidatus Nanoarchaeia archaeon]
MATNQRSVINVILIIGALVLGFLLLRPFFTALAFAAVIAFVFFRLHKWLSARMNENIAAGLITILVLSIIIAIIALGVQTLLNEFARIFVLAGEVNFKSFFPDAPELAGSFESLTRFILQKVIEVLTAFVTQLPRIMLSLFIFTVSVFFFLRDGERLYKWIEKVFPLPLEKKGHMFRDLKRYSNSLVKVWFLIGLLQGVVATIGFALFGLPAPLLAGILAAVFSIIPVLGPGTLYVPTAALLFLGGDTNSAIGILVYGLSIGWFLDYLVRPYFAGKWSALHPLIILVGMLGGILVVGPSGFIVGPALLVVVISILHGAGLEFLNRREK